MDNPTLEDIFPVPGDDFEIIDTTEHCRRFNPSPGVYINLTDVFIGNGKWVAHKDNKYFIIKR